MESVNYYEHHLGDYAEATAHLTFIEDAAYSRCIRKYYTTEKPLPSDVSAVQRLVAARTKEERAAVELVLNEFFTLQEDGWHNRRCDEEIAKYREGDSDRRLKQENEKERQRRSRERRRAIFEQLRAHGIVPKWDAPITELESHLSRVTGRDSHAPVTVTDSNLSRVQNAPATGSQSPVPTSQSPLSIHTQSARESGGSGKASEREPERLLERLQESYPKGIYPQSDWLLAEREARRRLDEGHSVEELIAGVKRYAAQCEAKGSTGTQYVESPKKFFTLPECKFRDPFPLPAAARKTNPEDTGWRPTA